MGKVQFSLFCFFNVFISGFFLYLLFTSACLAYQKWHFSGGLSCLYGQLNSTWARWGRFVWVLPGNSFHIFFILQSVTHTLDIKVFKSNLLLPTRIWIVLFITLFSVTVICWAALGTGEHLFSLCLRAGRLCITAGTILAERCMGGWDLFRVCDLRPHWQHETCSPFCDGGEQFIQKKAAGALCH